MFLHTLRQAFYGMELFLLAFMLSSCMSRGVGFRQAKPEGIQGKVQATLYPMGDSGVMGVIEFSQKASGVSYRGVLRGLSGEHGFHLHNGPDCSQIGDHWSLQKARHGHPESPNHHTGDIYNINAGETINGLIEGVSLSTPRAPDTPTPTLARGKAVSPSPSIGLIGRLIVVTEGPDNYITDPDGASGLPIACGVIGQ